MFNELFRAQQPNSGLALYVIAAAAAVTLPVSHDQNPQLITNMYSVILTDTNVLVLPTPCEV